jgi:glycosyltransferase involved in cell wall biosynthesis
MLKLVKNYGYGLRQTDFALKASRCIVEAGCDAVVLQYHGEHWLLPVFYYLNDTIGAVYLNMVPPRPRPLALPFQESTTERRLADKLLRLPPVGKWESLSMKKVALFMTPSRFQLRQAKKQRVTGRKRTAVVPLGVNHDDFLPTGEEEPFALYLGRIHPHKSLELAIMSMERTKRDYSLVIAGDVDDQNLWYAKKLSSLAERMKVADRFQLVLNPSDLQVLRLMQRCSVFLFPSTIDTFGLVALEAMACGKPVIACNKGGVPEVIGDAGFLLEPNVQQWQKTVARVLSDTQIRRQMGEKALERSNSFSWEKTTDQLLCSFDHLSDPRLD